MTVGRHQNKKTACGGAPLGRQQKENFHLKDEFTSCLQNKNLAPSSITHYMRELALFLAWIDKEEIQIQKSDILTYLEHLKNKRNLQNISRSRVLNSLNHYFSFLLQKEQIQQNPCAFLKIRGTKQKNLFRIYSPEELTAIYDNFYTVFVRSYDDSHIPKNQRKQSSLSKQRNAVILNILVHQGVTTKEIDTLTLCDLDVMNATLKIKGARKSNERILTLNAQQIGVLMHYLQYIRPQFLEYHTQENDKLFLSLPQYSEQQTTSNSVMQAFKPLVKHLKEIDTHFESLQQIRTSVITNWLTVHGLRKTQYLAGHRYISSTEKYKTNDLQQLSDTINKLHPF